MSEDPTILLENHLRRLCQNIQVGYYKNEAEVRSEFTRLVKNFIESNPQLKGLILHEEEMIIDGRPDARIGKFLLEFETPILPKGKIRKQVTEEKIKQASDYIATFRSEGKTARALVTNGLEMVFLDEGGEVVDRGPICEA